MSQYPDLVPPLAAMAAVRKGTCRLSNAGRLRVKESDRLASVTAALNGLGADIQEGEDSLTIRGRDSLAGGGTVDSQNDHRIAMMAAVAAQACQRPVTILGAECVNKSYPNFWEQMCIRDSLTSIFSCAMIGATLRKRRRENAQSCLLYTSRCV